MGKTKRFKLLNQSQFSFSIMNTITIHFPSQGMNHLGDHLSTLYRVAGTLLLPVDAHIFTNCQNFNENYAKLGIRSLSRGDVYQINQDLFFIGSVEIVPIEYIGMMESTPEAMTDVQKFEFTRRLDDCELDEADLVLYNRLSTKLETKEFFEFFLSLASQGRLPIQVRTLLGMYIDVSVSMFVN